MIRIMDLDPIHPIAVIIAQASAIQGRKLGEDGFSPNQIKTRS